MSTPVTRLWFLNTILEKWLLQGWFTGVHSEPAPILCQKTSKVPEDGDMSQRPKQLTTVVKWSSFIIYLMIFGNLPCPSENSQTQCVNFSQNIELVLPKFSLLDSVITLLWNRRYLLKHLLMINSYESFNNSVFPLIYHSLLVCYYFYVLFKRSKIT